MACSSSRGRPFGYAQGGPFGGAQGRPFGYAQGGLWYQDAVRDAGSMRWSLGEMGSLIVSTPILPRCKVGDLIRAFRPPYLRCTGRGKWWTLLRYAWGEFMILNPGRL